jgi:hypothetical protein
VFDFKKMLSCFIVLKRFQYSRQLYKLKKIKTGMPGAISSTVEQPLIVRKGEGNSPTSQLYLTVSTRMRALVPKCACFKS